MLYNEDCLTAFKKIKTESVDLIVTDPPYKIIAGGVSIEEREDEAKGILRKRAISDGTKCSNKWLKKGIDNIPCVVKQGKMFTHNDIEFKEWLPEAYRVLKEGTHCYIMVNARNLKDLQTEAEKVGFKFVNILVWHKNNATPNKYYMQQAEFILLLRKGKARNINNMGTSNILSAYNIIGNKLHPTQKPVELMEVLIANSSNEGDTVLDPFFGSGSTIIAAEKLNRKAIGFEIDEEYYKTAKERIENKTDRQDFQCRLI